MKTLLPRLVAFDANGYAICAGSSAEIAALLTEGGRVRHEVMQLPSESPDFIDFDVRGKTKKQIEREVAKIMNPRNSRPVWLYAIFNFLGVFAFCSLFDVSRGHSVYYGINAFFGFMSTFGFLCLISHKKWVKITAVVVFAVLLGLVTFLLVGVLGGYFDGR